MKKETFTSKKNNTFNAFRFIKSLPDRIFGKVADVFSTTFNLALGSVTWIYDGFAQAVNELNMHPTGKRMETGVTLKLIENAGNSIDHMFSASGKLSDYFSDGKKGLNPLLDSYKS